jgi:hypothetical protein
MKLRHATLIAVPMIGFVLYLTYLRLQPSDESNRDVSALPVRPSQSMVTTVEGGTAASVEDIRALREEVASLRAGISLLRRQNPKQAESASTNPDSQPGADVRSDTLARAEAARERQNQMEAVDAAFRQQTVDPTWSANSSSSIRNALNSEDVGGIQADNIDCRSDSCRVELRDDGSGRLSKSLPMLAQQLAGTMPNITANNISQANGDSTVVLYLSRPVEQQASR